MIDDDEKRLEAQRAGLLKEEAHYASLCRVFGTPEGQDVLEWLLEISGFWRSTLETERQLGKFELGRFVFNQICMADADIAHAQLDRKRRQAEAVRNSEKQRILNHGR